MIDYSEGTGKLYHIQVAPGEVGRSQEMREDRAVF